MTRRLVGRPARGQAPAQVLTARQTMRGGQYTMDAMMRSHAMRHHLTGKPLSYASVNALTQAGVERVVEGLTAEMMPRLQHPNTDTNHDRELHLLAQRYFLEEVTKPGGCVIICQDEVSKRKRAWTVLTAIGEGEGGARISELIDTHELHMDADGHVKTGANIGDGMWGSLLKLAACGEEDSQPKPQVFARGSLQRQLIYQVQWGMIDSTSTNTGLYHGCHAVLRRQMLDSCGHLLYFTFNCLAHVANNECGDVLQCFKPEPDVELRELFHRRKKVRLRRNIIALHRPAFYSLASL